MNQPLLRERRNIPGDRPLIVFLAEGVGDDLLAIATTAIPSQKPTLILLPDGTATKTLVVVRLDETAPGKVRSLAGAALRLLQGQGAEACTVCLPEAPVETIQAIAEGILSANHVFVSTGVARGAGTALPDLDFASGDAEAALYGLRHAWLTSLATLSARDLATEPANELTPESFRDRCVALAEASCLDLSVMAQAELERAGMQGILTVASGSAHGAYLIELSWRPPGDTDASPIVLVGKTVTFDSGGISLKVAQDMDHMKADMGGGAAVFGVMRMIAELKPDFPVTAVFAVVENMPGPNAMRPSDVIRTASGKTVEIINTDAEGRLILADALHHATGLSPRVVIDMATLTGATDGIFGPIGIGTFANDDTWFANLQEADTIADERVWRLPLWDEYLDFLKSPVAGLRNFSVLGQRGSTPTAAAFLSQFVGPHPWMHLDLYNTCWNPSDANSLMPVGPTGSGARVMAQMLINMTKEKIQNS